MAKYTAFTIPAAALFATLATPAMAQSSQTPPELADLVGARAAGGETQMQSRGYTNTGSSRTDGTSWTFWWNGRTCVSIATRDGRYASINRVPDANCSQQGGPRPPSDNRPPQGGRPDYGPPPGGGRPDYGPGPGGGYGDNGDNSLTLICFGGGTKVTTDYRSGYRYNYDSHKFEPYSETGLGRQGYQSDIQIEIWHGRGRIHLGGNMVPAIRSGGDNGWWDLTDLVIGPDRITGRYRLNGLNRPTVTIDRRSGAITIRGPQPFNGRCEAGNWRGGGGQF
ncbi:hypothetical protein P1X14_04235 [Sphingomonas sp. AOB5]|uniref:hypothetical protein n=1 Tax=Sphingomonas sp. AOB5 TaxID=3034017 RepID=UPI0023F92032|nr:hypothetical protein [Sphingomonas sp. AOB5]MDF7774445.1 hypothetical protein [Sphingomonas sp. AOB5]